MDFASTPDPPVPQATQAEPPNQQNSLFAGYHPLVTFGLPLGLILASIILFLANPDWLKAQLTIVSPLADHQSGTTDQSGTPPRLADEALLTQPHTDQDAPTQFVARAQGLLDDATQLSQNLEQTEDDKQAIIATLQQALDTISEGIAIYPKASQLWYQRGRIYLAMEKISSRAIDQAIVDTKRAYQLSPTNPQYAKALAQLYLRQGAASPASLTEALGYLTVASQLSPHDTFLLTALVNLQMKMGLLSQASRNLEELLSQTADPNLRQQFSLESATIKRLLAQAANHQTETPPATLGQDNNAELNINTRSDTENTQVIAAPQLQPDKIAPQANVVVAAASETLSPYQETIAGSAYSDTATLPAGQTKITVANQTVTSANPIYVVPLQATNATLYVSSKKAGSYFTVAVDTPLSTDLRFRYWITR